MSLLLEQNKVQYRYINNKKEEKNMSKMGNLVVELQESAQDYISDYADKKYLTLLDAKDAYLEKNGEWAESIFQTEAETASEIGII
jgi:hypothetical protein